jgi:hypothetical protein
MTWFEILAVPLIVSWCISVGIAVHRCRKPLFGFLTAVSIAVTLFAAYGLVYDIYFTSHKMPGIPFVMLTIHGILYSPIPGLVAVLILSKRQPPTQPNLEDSSQPANLD